LLIRGFEFGGWDALENQLQTIDFIEKAIFSSFELPPKLPPKFRA
jgi:hypothetical protein